jgi:hypothetical protein
MQTALSHHHHNHTRYQLVIWYLFHKELSSSDNSYVTCYAPECIACLDEAADYAGGSVTTGRASLAGNAAVDAFSLINTMQS